MRIVYYPKFVTGEQLTDRYWRAAHYLCPYLRHISSIDFAAAGEVGPPPEYLDQSLPQRAAQFRDRVRFVTEPDIVHADLVIVWDGARGADHALRGKASVAVLDPGMLHEGDLGIELGRFFGRPDPAVRREAHRILRDAIAGERGEVVHVLGTGPSLAALDISSLAPGVAIVCNNVVKDADLMARLRPRFVTAVDPIFHAGPSRHAQVFRECLMAALDAHRPWFAIQERDLALYRTLLPERLWGLFLALPVRFALGPQLDLERRFWVTATRNVLSLTMLPLAAALGRDTRIYGCDGRAAQDAVDFWEYAATAAFPAEAALQRQAHPGFFSLDIPDYYALHCETLRRWIRAIERRGGRVRAGTPSHIPALAERPLQVGSTAPAPQPNLLRAGRRAYFWRNVQSLYGAFLNGPLTPVWAAVALQGVVRALCRVVRRNSPRWGLALGARRGGR